jgi:hypothetical protein
LMKLCLNKETPPSLGIYFLTLKDIWLGKPIWKGLLMILNTSLILIWFWHVSLCKYGTFLTHVELVMASYKGLIHVKDA